MIIFVNIKTEIIYTKNEMIYSKAFKYQKIFYNNIKLIKSKHLTYVKKIVHKTNEVIIVNNKIIIRECAKEIRISYNS